MSENEISSKIIGAAIEVHKQLGPGLLESTYETCLAYELKQMGLDVKQQQALPVVYKEVKLDAGYRIDLLIENKVIIEIKSVENEVLSIGFPISVLEKLKENRQPEEYDNYCSLQSNIVFSLLLYEEWYQNQIANIKRVDRKYLEEYTLKDTIKNYPLANKTPIEVFIWVAKLQKLISK